MEKKNVVVVVVPVGDVMYDVLYLMALVGTGVGLGIGAGRDLTGAGKNCTLAVNVLFV